MKELKTTLILTARAPYTFGTILTAGFGLQQVRAQVLAFHAYKKKEMFHLLVPQIGGVNKFQISNVELWNQERDRIRKEFPLISYIGTGLCYDDTGFFCNDWIVADSLENLGNKRGWYVEMEFLSDLPQAFHIVEDYRA